MARIEKLRYSLYDDKIEEIVKDTEDGHILIQAPPEISDSAVIDTQFDKINKNFHRYMDLIRSKNVSYDETQTQINPNHKDSSPLFDDLAYGLTYLTIVLLIPIFLVRKVVTDKDPIPESWIDKIAFGKAREDLIGSKKLRKSKFIREAEKIEKNKETEVTGIMIEELT